VDDRSKLWGLRQHRDEAWDAPWFPGVDVEAEEAWRVELAETAQEGAVGCVVVPAPADSSGEDKGGRVADAEQDLDE
jgi:hypothetical protein